MADRSKQNCSIISHRIRMLRNAKSLTQADLAKRLQKSESAVRMWELGKSEPDLETVCMLSELFAVSTDFLLGMAEEQTHAASQAEQTVLMLMREVHPDSRQIVLEMIRAALNAKNQ